jgi:hypothetical protein
MAVAKPEMSRMAVPKPETLVLAPAENKPLEMGNELN